MRKFEEAGLTDLPSTLACEVCGTARDVYTKKYYIKVGRQRVGEYWSVLCTAHLLDRRRELCEAKVEEGGDGLPSG
jgi:hypothetical protein